VYEGLSLLGWYFFSKKSSLNFVFIKRVRPYYGLALYFVYKSSGGTHSVGLPMKPLFSGDLGFNRAASPFAILSSNQINFSGNYISHQL